MVDMFQQLLANLHPRKQVLYRFFYLVFDREHINRSPDAYSFASKYFRRWFFDDMRTRWENIWIESFQVQVGSDVVIKKL